MEYYKLLQLDREPFSNSPDPEYFFNSRQHMGCLQKLELAVRLKRGLNVVIGDVGTGKTTLCRQMIRNFSTEPDIETHLVLDPSFDSSTEFLKSILVMICSPDTTENISQTEMKEMIKRTLFKRGVDDGKTIVLIIDEGQKIAEPCLEILRELLNYETNNFKLLQIVIFAQLEFNTILQTHANFGDRINLLHHLDPLSFTDTRQLIQHRLKLSSSASKPIALFTLPALWAIYRASRGYPRKIIHLCHQSILALIIQNRTKARWALIHSCKRRLGVSLPTNRNIIVVTSLSLLLALLIIVLSPVFRTRDNRHSNAHEPFYKIANKQAISPTLAETPHADEGSIRVASNESSGQIKAPPLSAGHIQGTVKATTDRVTISSDPPPTPGLQSSPPDRLGEIMVRPGDTLSAMVQQVYGTHHNRFLISVIEANPHIEDPNDIDIGNIIAFPSLRVNTATPEKPFYLIVIDEHQTLQAAIQRLHKISTRLTPEPKMVASWSPIQGLRFQLIQRQSFPSQETARIHIDELPYSIATQAVIFSGWPTETVFYSDPFQKRSQRFE